MNNDEIKYLSEVAQAASQFEIRLNTYLDNLKKYGDLYLGVYRQLDNPHIEESKKQLEAAIQKFKVFLVPKENIEKRNSTIPKDPFKEKPNYDELFNDQTANENKNFHL